MNDMWRITVIGWAIVGLAVFGVMSCKRASRAERDAMSRVAGTWVWKQPKVAQPTVEVLELTASGKYKRSTCREIGGQRKLLYVKRFTSEIVPEPEDPTEIAKLKKSGFEPGVETGRYILALEEKIQKIIFESDKLTSVEKRERRGLVELPLVIHSTDRLILGGQTYDRQAP